MGQKVNAQVFRLGTLHSWGSRWFDEKNYKETLKQDFFIRDSLIKRLAAAGVSQVVIERSINSLKITIYVSKPGMVIGRGGSGLEDLKNYIVKIINPSNNPKNMPKLDIKIEHVKEPNLDAYLVAKNVSDQLAKRLPFKRVLAHSAERTMASGAKGIRIILSGRISGAAIARREKIQRGTVPLSTIRENVLYASVPSLTKAGYVGVRVWINVGEEK